MSSNAQHENDEDVDGEAHSERAKADGATAPQTYDPIDSKNNHST